MEDEINFMPDESPIIKEKSIIRSDDSLDEPLDDWPCSPEVLMEMDEALLWNL